MTGAEFILPVVLGVSLAAAAGFRVFVPLLALGASAHWGFVPVSDGFAWVATTPALIMLAVAAVAEVIAYYIPGVDNLLDTLAAPAALIAGAMVSAAVMTGMPPMLKWTLAIIAGGGAASLTQGATTIARGHSTVLTGGTGNHILSTGEIIGAVVLSLLSLIAPWLALALALIAVFIAYRFIRRMRKNRPAEP